MVMRRHWVYARYRCPGVRCELSSAPAVALREVGRHRARRPNDLIGNRLQRSRNPHGEIDGGARCFEGLLVGNEVGVLQDVGLLTSGSFMPPLEPVGHTMSRVAQRPAAGRPALDIGCPPAIPRSERPGGDHHGLAEPDLCPGRCVCKLPLTLTLKMLALPGCP